MTTTRAPLRYDGQEIKAIAGTVVVVVQRIHSGAFRLSIRYGSFFGAEVPELSRSWADEETARQAARTATVLFRAGLTVQQAVDMQEGAST
jgi:hypothetical protein